MCGGQANQERSPRDKIPEDHMRDEFSYRSEMLLFYLIKGRMNVSVSRRKKFKGETYSEKINFFFFSNVVKQKSLNGFLRRTCSIRFLFIKIKDEYEEYIKIYIIFN